MAEQDSASSEAKEPSEGTLTYREVITAMYRGIHNRNPDQRGADAHVKSLMSGKKLESILHSAVSSREFERKFLKKLGMPETDTTKRLFPIDFVTASSESGKGYLYRRSSGFLDRFLSGETVLDLGYRGYANPQGIPCVPHAIGVDLDYPGYDGIRLPFGNGTVDCVFSSHCLEHVTEYKDAIREWHRVLKVGGFIVCIVPSQHLYEKKKAPPSRFNHEHKRFYTPSSLLREFEESLQGNSYRVRYLEENDLNYDYSVPANKHPKGAYEIVLAVEKIRKPDWRFDE